MKMVIIIITITIIDHSLDVQQITEDHIEQKATHNIHLTLSQLDKIQWIEVKLQLDENLIETQQLNNLVGNVGDGVILFTRDRPQTERILFLTLSIHLIKLKYYGVNSAHYNADQIILTSN